ncbi:hypothetical protein L596_005289 [Steinernema carpocapsae]|uniref:Innexin n=1 Tax=Steinernema carpocapsae TaxID=34508 RepID=A0A4U8V037_STECR|nr:hypothetical protein L596_005289 [Steinernema carpocapsae]
MAREWRDSGKFPRVTLCDFEIRVLGNVHRHTVQCVLVINMFTEKIFIFLWLWMLLLAFSTAINLLAWTISLSLSSYKQAFIEKSLGVESEDVQKFVDKYLRTDGIFALQMLSSHAGSLMCTCVVQALWRRFLKQSGKLPPTVVASTSDHEEDKNQSWRGDRGGGADVAPKFPISTHFV